MKLFVVVIIMNVEEVEEELCQEQEVEEGHYLDKEV